MDPENILNPACSPGPPISCPPMTPAADGRWGIFEDIRMFSRNNGPGGSTKVYAVATSPFSIGNTGGVSFVGDLRLLDVTNPADPKQLTSFPNSPLGESSNNGCRTFQAARSAVPTPDGSHAIVSYYDGVQPPVPPVFGYPPAADGGETPAGQVEGNAADVQTFVGPDGHILAILSEDDVDP